MDMLCLSSVSRQVPPDAMLRCSRSEFGAADLMPTEVELGMRVRLRQMRFGQPQKYAQMEQSEVQKFLSSKSVHNWLSEWNLSRTFSVSNRENVLEQQQCQKADFCVQCAGEEIDSILGNFETASSGQCRFGIVPSDLCHNPSATKWLFSPNSLSRRPRNLHPPSLMNASTNTQTTETTRTSGGTGGRMHVFRRASLLEEYAQKTLQKLEEREEEEKRMNGAKEWDATERMKRSKRRSWWRRWCARKCCVETETNHEDSGDEKDTYSSAEVTNDCRPTKLGRSIASSSSNEQQKPRQIGIVKRFTLSRSNWGGERTPMPSTDDATPPNGTNWDAWEGMKEGERGRGEGKGWMREREEGNYDNVPQEVYEDQRRGGPTAGWIK